METTPTPFNARNYSLVTGLDEAIAKAGEHEEASLAHLPVEIVLDSIFNYLPKKDAYHLGNTCKAFHKLRGLTLYQIKQLHYDNKKLEPAMLISEWKAHQGLQCISIKKCTYTSIPLPKDIPEDKHLNIQEITISDSPAYLDRVTALLSRHMSLKQLKIIRCGAYTSDPSYSGYWGTDLHAHKKTLQSLTLIKTEIEAFFLNTLFSQNNQITSLCLKDNHRLDLKNITTWPSTLEELEIGIPLKATLDLLFIDRLKKDCPKLNALYLLPSMFSEHGTNVADLEEKERQNYMDIITNSFPPGVVNWTPSDSVLQAFNAQGHADVPDSVSDTQQ